MCHVLKFSHVEKSPGNWLTILPLTASSVGDESGTGDEVPGKGDIWTYSTGIQREKQTSDFWRLSKDRSHLLMTRKQKSPDNLTLL